jgi:topoisomerase-4 subunit A
MEKLLFTSLEKIFIENRIYRDIEEVEESFEEVIHTVDLGLEPYKPSFYRKINRDDILRLLEIRIKRISKFDSFKADEAMKAMQEELAAVEHNLTNITDYSIEYYRRLIKDFGKGKERKTEISQFETIAANQVAVNNSKLYANLTEGFIGSALKKDDFICECSDIDDIIVFRKDGKFIVNKLQDKVFVGKNIIHVAVFKKGNERMTYNMIYHDGESGLSYVKRFNIKGVTRDKEYELTKGTKKSKVLHFSANQNGEAEVITIYLNNASTAKKKVFDYDFSDLAIKGRGASGNRLSVHGVRRVAFKSKGASTLSGLNIYFDTDLNKLNTEERGDFIGEFNGDDNILIIHNDGSYELTSYELTNKYDYKKIQVIAKFDPEKIISAIYFEGKSKTHYVKRFKIETTTIGKKFLFISETPGSKLEVASLAKDPKIELAYKTSSRGEKLLATYSLVALIEPKGWRSIGNKLTTNKVIKIKLIPPTKEEIEAEQKEKEASVEEELQVGTATDLSIDNDQMTLF